MAIDSIERRFAVAVFDSLSTFRLFGSSRKKDPLLYDFVDPDGMVNDNFSLVMPIAHHPSEVVESDKR